MNIFSSLIETLDIFTPTMVAHGRLHMIKHTTADRHVEIFPKLEKVSLNFFESKSFLVSESDPSKFPRAFTALFRSLLATKKQFKVHHDTQ